MADKKRLAVVGYGGMGSWHVKRALDSDVVECAGIWDIAEKRRALALENGIHVYGSFEELLADETVDIVTVAVPNELHMPMAIRVMEAGKNVICEKPVCMNSGELEKIIEVSKKTGKLFTVHQNRRWDSDYLIMKELYASGKLGKVFNIESRYQGSRGIPGDWRGHRENGGGMMLDWGVHLIDQMVGIVYDSKIKEIYCRCDHLTNDEVDDGFKLELYFENGLRALVEVGTSNFISLPRFYATGMSGAALIPDWKSDCRVILCKEWNEDNVVPVATAAGLTKTMAPRDAKTTEEIFIPRPASDVHEFYRNVCLAIDGKAEQIVKHAQVMRVMKIMEAAFRSDELGVPVEFEDEIV